MKKTLALLLLATLPATTMAAASREPVRGRNGMVVSTSDIASQVGATVLQNGGNAVDAAVAVGLALAVTWPSAGNLGGGGFLLLRKADGTVEAIDYRERAPLAATRDMYVGADGKVVPGLSTEGYKAAGVPGRSQACLSRTRVTESFRGATSWSRRASSQRTVSR